MFVLETSRLVEIQCKDKNISQILFLFGGIGEAHTRQHIFINDLARTAL